MFTTRLYRLLGVVLCVMLLTSAVAVAAPAGVATGLRTAKPTTSTSVVRTAEADDNIPGVIAPASPVSGTLTDGADSDDVYRIDLTAGTTINIDLTGTGTDFDLYLYGPTATDVYNDAPVDVSSGATCAESVSYAVTSTGTYYMDVYQYEGSGSYTLTYSVVPAGPDLRVDSLGGPLVAVPGSSISLSNKVLNDNVLSSGVITSVQFYLSTDQTITAADTLVGSRSVPVLAAGAYSTAATQLTIPPVADGEYYLGAIVDPDGLVAETSESNNTYTGDKITVSSSPDALDGDIPGVAAPASPIVGTLNATGDAWDVHRVTLTAGTVVSLSLAGPVGPDYDLYLFGPGSTSVNGEFLTGSFNDGTAETISWKVLTTGTYYLGVNAYSGAGNYTLAYSSRVLRPMPYLTITAPGKVKKGDVFFTTGFLTPRHPAGGHDVKVQCYLNGSLKKTVYATNWNYIGSNGALMTKYVSRFALPTPGKWLLKASVPLDGEHEARVVSRYVYVGYDTLSISSNGVISSYEHASGLSGYLRDIAGKPLAGRTVKLQQSYSAYGPWTTVKRLTSTSTGKVSTSVHPKAARYYRFTYAGDSVNMPRASAAKRVRSTYRAWSGYNSGTRGEWSNGVYLTRGTHRITAYAARGLGSLNLSNSDDSWVRTFGSNLPAARTRTYYVTVPRGGTYSLGWSGNRFNNQLMRMTIW